MRVLNEREMVKQAIHNWVSGYGLDRTYGADKRGRKVGAELLALDQDTATAEQVHEIIGNSLWAGKACCDSCGAVTWDLVELGEPPDYESATACVCRGCLTEALRMLDASLLTRLPD